MDPNLVHTLNYYQTHGKSDLLNIVESTLYDNLNNKVILNVFIICFYYILDSDDNKCFPSSQ